MSRRPLRCGNTATSRFGSDVIGWGWLSPAGLNKRNKNAHRRSPIPSHQSFVASAFGSRTTCSSPQAATMSSPAGHPRPLQRSRGHAPRPRHYHDSGRGRGVRYGGSWTRGQGGTVNPPHRSKEGAWQPSTYSRRASSRPYQEKVITMTDNHGYVFAPTPVAPVNATAWLRVLAGRRSHARGAPWRASACLPPHAPSYWGSRSARRKIYGVRPIPMRVATTRGEDAMARVSLDLENKDDLKVLQAEGWRIAPGLVPGEPNQGLVAETRGSPPRLARIHDSGWAVGDSHGRRVSGLEVAWHPLRFTIQQQV